MKCPKCGSSNTQVSNSRKTKSSSQIWRRRQCQSCQMVFSTYEKPELAYLQISSSDNKTRPYQRFLLTMNLVEVFDAQTVHQINIDALLDTIEVKLMNLHQNPISTAELHKTVLQTLKPANLAAYMRYVANHTSTTNARELNQILRST